MGPGNYLDRLSDALIAAEPTRLALEKAQIDALYGDRGVGVIRVLDDGEAEYVPLVDFYQLPIEPTPCATCEGTGHAWVHRMDDQIYPKRCWKCGGSGIAKDAARTSNR